ncbi:hypothetical protein F2Q70_00036840 [Brassica cretica]|uniref:Uncharacterized protein n=1 Tax=Brassica cretica TaxID=69181 RepID=A0A8S9H671_BRACR|nr:hypothetical protein F2Q68_00034154 [Brassica cretica]KAF2584791.1 hypothetical protein F2Q70_00036840 [Brassica cretica]
MAPDACAATPRATHVWLHLQDTCRTPPLLPDVRLHDWNACKTRHQYTHVDQHASVACAETPRAWSIHLVLLHVRQHVQLPCTATPRASVDTQLAGWLTRDHGVRLDGQSCSCLNVGWTVGLSSPTFAWAGFAPAVGITHTQHTIPRKDLREKTPTEN